MVTVIKRLVLESLFGNLLKVSFQHVCLFVNSGKSGNNVPTDRPLLVTEAQLSHRHGGVHRLTHMYRHAHSHLDR